MKRMIFCMAVLCSALAAEQLRQRRLIPYYAFISRIR